MRGRIAREMCLLLSMARMRFGRGIVRRSCCLWVIKAPSIGTLCKVGWDWAVVVLLAQAYEFMMTNISISVEIMHNTLCMLFFEPLPLSLINGKFFVSFATVAGPDS